MQPGPSNPIIGFILGVACLAGGYYVWKHVGVPARERAAASVNWPVTDGQVTLSQLHRKDPKHDRQAMFSMEITYDYKLDGKKFEGSRVWFGDHFSSSDPDHFRAAIQRYPVGKAVKVFYDPQAPGESVLEPGSNWNASIWYLVGIGLMVFGAVALASSGIVLVILGAALAIAVGGSRQDLSGFGDATSPPVRPRAEDDGDDGIEIG